MNYSKQLFVFTLMFGASAFGMERPLDIPTSAMPIRGTTTPLPEGENESTKATFLFAAIAQGEAHKVEKLLSESTDEKALANAVDSQGRTPLMRAALSGHPNAAKITHILIEHGADVNKTNRAGIAPLRETMIAGNIENFKELLRANADVNKADNAGITPLMMAVSQGPSEAAFLLIAADADVNAADNRGQTVWNYSNFSSPKKVTPAEKEKIQKMLEEKGARKESRKK